MTLFSIIKDVLFYDPDKHAICPPLKTNTKGQFKEKDISADYFTVQKSGQLFVSDNEKGQILSYSQVKSERQLKNVSDKLSDNEKKIVLSKGLSIEKAAMLKPYYAKGYGRKRTADIINQKGFGESTIGKFFNIFD